MTISEIKPGEGVKNEHFTEDTLSVDLVDGRTYNFSATRLVSSTVACYIETASKLADLRRRLWHPLAEYR